jgi:hypothetical protein
MLVGGLPFGYKNTVFVTGGQQRYISHAFLWVEPLSLFDRDPPPQLDHIVRPDTKKLESFGILQETIYLLYP